MTTKNHDISLLQALGIEELQPDEQEELLLDVNDLIFKGSLVRLIEQMDDSTKTEFDALMESDADEDEVTAFLEEHVPGADQAIADTVEELKNDILAVTGESQD